MDKRPTSLKRIKTRKQANKFIKEQVVSIRKQVGKDKVGDSYGNI